MKLAIALVQTVIAVSQWYAVERFAILRREYPPELSRLLDRHFQAKVRASGRRSAILAAAKSRKFENSKKDVLYCSK